MEKLKKLYNPILQPEQIEHDGIPRIIVFCYNANATPELAVATSPEKWWPGSFLMHWAAISRQSRLGAGGQQIIKNLINQVDNRVNEEVVKANLRSQKLGVRNLAMTGDSLLELNGFVAQAFDGKSFLPRERCWRCRLTFGFNWLWPEGDPKGLSVAKIKDFEFRWDNASDTRKGGEGKCGEYILWWNYIANITQRSTPSAPDSSTWALANVWYRSTPPTMATRSRDRMYKRRRGLRSVANVKLSERDARIEEKAWVGREYGEIIRTNAGV